MTTIFPPKTAKQLVRAYEKYGSLKAIARATGGNREKIRNLYHQAMAEGMMESIKLGGKTSNHMKAAVAGQLRVSKPKVRGRRKALKAKVIERDPDKVTRFLFTCAQNNTKLHEGLWTNLQKLAGFYKAKIHVSRFAYVRAGWGARGDKKDYFAARNTGDRIVEDFWFDQRIEPYVSDDRLEVAPGLVWCGEANITPTAARPLSGLETFTGRRSGIFPHVKLAMESIPSSEHDPVKFNYTTGTITQRNYIQRKEGLKAEFHHCYGALLVEVDPDGNWWCRQLNADSEGTLYDIDIMVKNGEITTNNPKFQKRAEHFVDTTFVEGVKWGDIHVAQMDQKVREAIWGEGGILDHLRAKHQFFDDLFDMYARNHHEMDDPHTMLQRYVTRSDDVGVEGVEAVRFLGEAYREWAKSVIVNSNHDRAIIRWLKDRRGQMDPVNMDLWHRLNSRVTQHIHLTGEAPIILRELMLEVMGWKKEPKGWTFLAQGDTYVICPSFGGGVDNGQHGDDGANGARGSTAGFAKIGRKMNKGHDHRATIYDSVYSSGCCLDLKNPPKYMRGPSSASNSHILTYLNGKRTILTQWGEDRAAWAAR